MSKPKTPFVRVYEFLTSVEPSKVETALKRLVNDLVEHVPQEALDAVFNRLRSEYGLPAEWMKKLPPAKSQDPLNGMYCSQCDEPLTDRPRRENSIRFYHGQPHCLACDTAKRQRLEMAVTQ